MDEPIPTIADALRIGKLRLHQTDSDTPGLDAEVLLRHVLDLDRTALFVRLADPIHPSVVSAFMKLIEERARRVPVAYLTGEREFMGLRFVVDLDVLVPRPETEILVEWAIRWLGARKNATVVDVGTGSGTIALSLATLVTTEVAPQIIAVDVSNAALAIAARNRASFGLQDRVALLQGSLLTSISGPVDLVLANLPYLRPEQIAENPHLTAEPRQALDGGVDGLSLIRQLLLDAPRVVARGGAIGIEIDPGQRAAVVTLAQEAFPGADIAVLPDLAGHDRHVAIQIT
jgi:release factor glutamine methyltransferase